MAYINDRLRHKRVVQHASIRREKSQQVSDAPGPYGHAKPSTSGAHASLHASPSFSSRKRQFSPSDTSLPSSSHRRQVSPIQAPEILESPVVPETPLPPTTADATAPMPPSEGEADADADAEPESFG